MIDRKKLNKAFASLRKAGITVRRNYLCCMGCASTGLEQELPAGTPVAYYHRQDAERLTAEKGLNIRHFITGKPVAHYQTRKKLGNTIAQLMRDAGLDVDYSGKPDTCVAIVPSPAVKNVLFRIRKTNWDDRQRISNMPGISGVLLRNTYMVTVPENIVSSFLHQISDLDYERVAGATA